MIRHALLLSAALLLLTAQPVIAQGEQAAQPAPAMLEGKPIKGKVLETMDSGGYTYLQVAADQGAIWVAIPKSAIEVGQEVTCDPGMVMKDFSSKSLGRTFAAIVFSPGLEGKGAPASPHGSPKKDTGKTGMSFTEALKAEQQAPGMAGAPQGSAPTEPQGQSAGSSGAIMPLMDVEVEKAEGENSLQVGECFEKAADYDKKTVKVRGKVMKVSHMIMGKNWLHIQDGTGNPMNNTHDLVVTTMDDPAVDSIVTVEGVLQADRDFGAGYRYEVIIEDAKVN